MRLRCIRNSPVVFFRVLRHANFPVVVEVDGTRWFTMLSAEILSAKTLQNVLLLLHVPGVSAEPRGTQIRACMLSCRPLCDAKGMVRVCAFVLRATPRPLMRKQYYVLCSAALGVRLAQLTSCTAYHHNFSATTATQATCQSSCAKRLQATVRQLAVSTSAPQPFRAAESRFPTPQCDNNGAGPR